MKITQRGIALLLALTFLFVSGCSPQTEEVPSVETQGMESPSTPSSAGEEARAAFSVSTPENDTDLGLKNIKIDTAEQELTEEQKIVLEYFDEDYLKIPSYDFLRRYPKVFQGAQITVYGTVKKVLSLDGDSYKLVLWLNVSPQDVAWDYAEEMYGGQYIIVTGETGDSSFMENDAIMAYGRYEGIETIEIDGTSYTIPSVRAYRAFYANTVRTTNAAAQKFDYPFIKKVAEAVFGKDIEIREPTPGEDLSEGTAMLYEYAFEEIPYLLIELENQSNANFTKFLFGTYSGEIVDAKGPFDSGIERYMEFSADFEHFFLFTYNTDLESLALAYYDKDFHKIWEREFEETTSAVYDYTKNNLYIVVNNELYIINIETGEDTFSPTYVGEKAEIRKLSDGILMVSRNRSDGIMKSKLNGNILWKSNLGSDVETVYGLQLVDGRIILQYMDADYKEHYALVDNATGTIELDADGVAA